eukprot:g2251.t1
MESILIYVDFLGSTFMMAVRRDVTVAQFGKLAAKTFTDIYGKPVTKVKDLRIRKRKMNPSLYIASTTASAPSSPIVGDARDVTISPTKASTLPHERITPLVDLPPSMSIGMAFVAHETVVVQRKVAPSTKKQGVIVGYRDENGDGRGATKRKRNLVVPFKSSDPLLTCEPSPKKRKKKKKKKKKNTPTPLTPTKNKKKPTPTPTPTPKKKKKKKRSKKRKQTAEKPMERTESERKKDRTTVEKSPVTPKASMSMMESKAMKKSVTTTEKKKDEKTKNGTISENNVMMTPAASKSTTGVRDSKPSTGCQVPETPEPINDSHSENDLAKRSNKWLKSELRKRNMNAQGRKSQLVYRLKLIMDREEGEAVGCVVSGGSGASNVKMPPSIKGTDNTDASKEVENTDASKEAESTDASKEVQEKKEQRGAPKVPSKPNGPSSTAARDCADSTKQELMNMDRKQLQSLIAKREGLSFEAVAKWKLSMSKLCARATKVVKKYVKLTKADLKTRLEEMGVTGIVISRFTKVALLDLYETALENSRSEKATVVNKLAKPSPVQNRHAVSSGNSSAEESSSTSSSSASSGSSSSPSSGTNVGDRATSSGSGHPLNAEGEEKGDPSNAVSAEIVYTCAEASEFAAADENGDTGKGDDDDEEEEEAPSKLRVDHRNMATNESDDSNSDSDDNDDDDEIDDFLNLCGRERKTAPSYYLFSKPLEARCDQQKKAKKKKKFMTFKSFSKMRH